MWGVTKNIPKGKGMVIMFGTLLSTLACFLIPINGGFQYKTHSLCQNCQGRRVFEEGDGEGRI